MQTTKQCGETENSVEPKYKWAVHSGRIAASGDGTAIYILNKLEKEGYEIFATHGCTVKLGGDPVDGLTVVARKRITAGPAEGNC